MTDSPSADLPTPSLSDGILTYELTSWRQFYPLIEEEVGKYDWGDIIWRGQKDFVWALISSYDRTVAKLMARGGKPNAALLLERHLERFKMAVRGRRGVNPPDLHKENDWWALGQHYGLTTPLLDWTSSPFAAAYFAFEDDSPISSRFHAVYGLNREAVARRNRDIEEFTVAESGRAPVLEFVEPFSDENPRLVAQGGLFTRAPLGVPIEQWVASNFEDASYPVLYRILVPSDERSSCLRSLNKMNINHLSLFPDLAGASRHVNLALEGTY